MDSHIANNLTIYKDIWTYIGINTGIFLNWPLIPDVRSTEDGEMYMNNCVSYECRGRPWYIGAVSGPKDIIIMIDNSGSMGGSRWQVAKNSASELVNSLTFADYVSVMLFSDDIIKVLLNENNLIPFDSKIKKELKSLLEKESNVNDDTNFEKGFEKAFDLFVNSKNETNSENRAKMIVVISDGHTSEKNTGVLNYIQERQEEIHGIFNETVIIHSSLIKTDRFDTSLMRQISCRNMGMSMLLENDDNLLGELITGILSFNALTSDRNTPVWVEPYEDFSGLGNMTTVVKPIFSE